MTPRQPEEPSFDAEEEQLLPVIFAHTAEEAEEYRQLLEDHGIYAVIADEDDGLDEDADRPRRARGRINPGVPILVPEVDLDEAGEILAEWDETGNYELPADYDDDDDDEDEEVLAGLPEPDAGAAFRPGDADYYEDEDDEDDETPDRC